MINDFNMNKIFCFGDGFATGHIWPEWPQILQALVPQHQVINTTGIGEGDIGSDGGTDGVFGIYNTSNSGTFTFNAIK